MTVTTKATVRVSTADLRDALNAVIPLAKKTSTGDDEIEHRVRLIFAASWLLICATNGQATGLAKVSIVEDSRGVLGVLEPDDGPMIVDLRPRRVKLILQQFKPRATDPTVDQAIQFSIDTTAKTLQATDVGGFWSDGESVVFPIEEAVDAFPDIVSLTGRALNGIGTSQVGKPLVTDSTLLSLFRPAGKAYGHPLQVESTGNADSRGFVVSCGARFLGTVESRHQDDDSLKSRDKWRNSWRDLLPARLAAV
ncbi:hypothetical protein [Kineosporia succinea]|uniref:DNA polymerase-3 subunit beta n=1 Tax=Kineosporia succinea TaxID=84632 RepID=A0ABT9P5V5_9ACTN|nr:hypothetical protein [Kineosporia succinea]MDP9828070.1 hypothetical protein [Kineosporia succinea]